MAAAIMTDDEVAALFSPGPLPGATAVPHGNAGEASIGSGATPEAPALPQLLTDDELDAILDPPSVVPAREPSPIHDLAVGAIRAFLGDHERVRVAASDAGERILVVITTKGTVTINAGIEPHLTVQRAEDLSVMENGARVAPEVTQGDHRHTAWALMLGAGQIVRTWRRGERNEDERYYVAKKSGEVRQINEMKYRELRAALSSSSGAGRSGKP
jgi:hypothetical protein